MNVVVPTCYSYRDTVVPFYRLFKKFWPDCKYDLWFISDHKDNTKEPISTVILGRDLGWAGNLLKGLEVLTGEGADEEDNYVLLMQDDFFICDEVDSDGIENALEFIKADTKRVCVRLYPCPGPDGEYNYLLGRIAKSADYRVSCQAAIWRADVLKDILSNVGVSAASFEIEGTLNRPEGEFYSLYRDKKYVLSYICSAITRGQWNPDAIELCIKNGIPIDTSLRGILSSK